MYSPVSWSVIEELSITDQLTGLYNRRYFNNTFTSDIKRSIRQSSLLSFIMLDIDFFKQYNDTYVHQEGDNVLSTIGQTLKNELKRAEDFACRIGGEEFGIVLFETDKEGAMVLAEKMRHAVEEAIYEKGGISVNMTMSIGISEKIEKEVSFERMIIHADEALYKAKMSGRNQIALAS